jgi:predicted amino acid racemase
MKAMNRARAVAEAYGLKDYVVNVPSANCCASMSLVHELGGNNAEPGHGLTGTTPLHAASNQPERVGYAYVTEVSHNYEDHAYCYGGGHYRRGHLASALVGTSSENAQLIPVSAPDNDSIDYHFELGRNAAVGDTAIMCFRTQIFVTRSRVAVVEGLSSGNPRIIGQFNHLGERED